MPYRGLIAIGVALLAVGCSREESPAPATGSSWRSSGAYGDGDYGGYGDGDLEITFLDEAPANTTLEDGITSLEFTRPDGERVSLQDFVGEKDVVLVVTRGNTGAICPYCSTQTARLIKSYDDFARRDAEVVVVYPIETASDSPKLDEFLAASRKKLSDPNRPVPFPVLLDVQLQAIDRLGIRKNLSKPATYIVDRTGEVRYAYVGSHLADRPSVAALIRQLEQLAGADTAPEA